MRKAICWSRDRAARLAVVQLHVRVQQAAVVAVGVIEGLRGQTDQRGQNARQVPIRSNAHAKVLVVMRRSA